MITPNTRIREEGVVVILDEYRNLTGIVWKDTNNKGEVSIYRTERIPYGEMKDFLETLVDVKKQKENG